jgi:hypothetical protein
VGQATEQFKYGKASHRNRGRRREAKIEMIPDTHKFAKQIYDVIIYMAKYTTKLLPDGYCFKVLRPS